MDTEVVVDGGDDRRAQ